MNIFLALLGICIVLVVIGFLFSNLFEEPEYEDEDMDDLPIPDIRITRNGEPVRFERGEEA